jgi:hypothetical protein
MSPKPPDSTESARDQKGVEELLLVDAQPDALELWIRAICGAAFGVVIGTGLWLQDWTLGMGSTLLVYIASISVSAYFAAKHGDRYWEGLSKFVRGWP